MKERKKVRKFEKDKNKGGKKKKKSRKRQIRIRKKERKFKKQMWDDLPRTRIGMLSLVTVSPVITAFHSCCLSHHVFDQVNLWPAWVGFETAIFWQCLPGTEETQRLYPLRHGARKAVKEETTQKTTKMRTKCLQ